MSPAVYGLDGLVLILILSSPGTRLRALSGAPSREASSDSKILLKTSVARRFSRLM